MYLEKIINRMSISIRLSKKICNQSSTPARTQDFSLLKIMEKSGLESLEIPANLPGQFSLSRQIFLHWAAATLKGLAEFQIKKF